MTLISNLTNNQIKEKVEELGNSPMTPNSHGFDKYKGMKIVDAARKQIEEFGDEKNAAIAIMGVVLGANRSWEKQVKDHVEKLKITYPTLTFKYLQTLLSEMDYKEFKKVWGHKDEKKYNTLRALVEKILEYANKYPALNDLELMTQWVAEFELKYLKDRNSPGSIPNIGIATFQHLRITFGIDTVKPDQRVRDVLREEFGAKLSAEDAIFAVEEIARITAHKVIMIDQIFVKYGSGYYAKKSVKRENC